MRLARALAAALALAASACGWSTGVQLPGEYRTIGVEIFRNESYLFDLERGLHREMTRSITSLVKSRLADPEHADLVVRGTILGYTRRGGVRSQDNRRLETGLLVRVSAELWDRREERIVAGPVPASVSIGYTLDSIGAEAAAQSRALANLAEEVVLDLFTTPLHDIETH